MKIRALLLFLLSYLSLVIPAQASYLLIPMDSRQTNHLKAYGLTYWVLGRQTEVEWLLNYRAGSFLFQYAQSTENELIVRNVAYEVISDADAAALKELIAQPESNMDVMRLENVPKIAVYTPSSKQPWDDAVTMVLTYAEIPYDIVYDNEVLAGDLPKYDWLHLHHEDFTGQLGKFYRNYRQAPWYIAQKDEAEALARKHGYPKISMLKLAVVKKIRDFCAGGGFLFAMCSAADTYDIALAAEGVDICESVYDGDPADEQAQEKLDFSKCFAFRNFKVYTNPYLYEYSDIDQQPHERTGMQEENDVFQLFTFSAKWDPIPSMLTQNHNRIIKGFMGQTTAFKKELIKPEVVIMGENKSARETRYLHGTYGKGTWTFYGGHDPEDYQHFVGEAYTDLKLHPNSPGYRLILNNILFPSAKKKKLKT